MEDGVDPRVLASVDESRRDFVRKLLMASAFVLPAVASFPMDAFAQSGGIHFNNTGLGPLLSTPGADSNPARRATPGAADTLPRAGAPGSPGNPILAPVAPTLPAAAPPPPTPAAPPTPPPRRF